MEPRTHSLVCLGTGHGSSMVYDGCCSAAYVLCADSEPVLLIGAGYGAVRQCMKYFGKVPHDVFVFSNRSHYAAELPVMLAVEASQQPKPLRLMSSDEVLSRVERSRLAELHSVMAMQNQDIAALVDLCPLAPLDVTGEEENPHVGGVTLRDDPGVSVRCFHTSTTEASAGVAVYCSHSGGRPLFALTGDSSFDADVIAVLVSVFHVVILDGRKTSSSDHASVEEVAEAHAAGVARRRRGAGADARASHCFVGHYGGAEDVDDIRRRLGRQARDFLLEPILEGQLVHITYTIDVSSVAPATRLKQIRVGLLATASAVAEVKSHRTQVPIKERRSTSRPEHTITSNVTPPSSAVRARSNSRGRAPSQSSRDGSAFATESRRVHADPVRQPLSLPASAFSEQPTAAAGGRLPKRVYVFSNEEKAAAGRMLMVQSYRTVQQVKLRVAELTGIRPIGELYLMPAGVVVVSVEQLTHGCYIVATKIGGEQFLLEHLPAALQGSSPRSAAPAQPFRVAERPDAAPSVVSGTSLSIVDPSEALLSQPLAGDVVVAGALPVGTAPAPTRSASSPRRPVEATSSSASKFSGSARRATQQSLIELMLSCHEQPIDHRNGKKNDGNIGDAETSTTATSSALQTPVDEDIFGNKIVSAKAHRRGGSRRVFGMVAL